MQSKTQPDVVEVVTTDFILQEGKDLSSFRTRAEVLGVLKGEQGRKERGSRDPVESKKNHRTWGRGGWCMCNHLDLLTGRQGVVWSK